MLHKSRKYQGVKEKKHDFEMSMPSCRMCCTIMVHFIEVRIIKSCSSSQTPEILPFCPKSFIDNRMKKDLLIIYSKV